MAICTGTVYMQVKVKYYKFLAWNNDKDIHSHSDRMPSRVEARVNAQGGYTVYQ